MGHRTLVMGIAVTALLVAACGESGSSLPEVPNTIVEAGASSLEEPVSTTTPVDDSDNNTETVEETPTTTVFARLVTPATEAPPSDQLTLATEDGEDLFAEFWEGDDIAVLFTHEYDAAQAGSGGQRPPQSSATLTTLTWTMAENGHTVLAVDFRGHGESTGTYSVKRSQIDMKTAYDYLIEQGYTTIVGMAQGGSAPVMADLSATDPEFELAGLGMLFTPLAETGFDAGQALAEMDEPVWLVGIDVGSFGGVTKRLEPKVVNLYDRTIFPAVPSGLQFFDIYGEEYLGRQLEFVETVGG
jgi:pimeloyl-ACP methyl ester carboxylesterase